MPAEHPLEELILRIVRSLEPEEKDELLAWLRGDPERAEDFADILVCIARADEPSRPLEDILAEQGFDAA